MFSFLFRPCRKSALPALFSVLVLISVLCIGAVSAKPPLPPPDFQGHPHTIPSVMRSHSGGETNLAPGNVLLITVEATAFHPPTEKGEDGGVLRHIRYGGGAGGGRLPSGPSPFLQRGWAPGGVSGNDRGAENRDRGIRDLFSSFG
ncbi:hypothetical protein [Methanogenium cariaci]|uniref:hypothetical protein n=1 Tax=Methanogenium cariaci TaxID=2197 RepID=UPI0012F68EBE|nr:hypothetical protein [Methanogenium cariaci]